MKSRWLRVLALAALLSVNAFAKDRLVTRFFHIDAAALDFTRVAMYLGNEKPYKELAKMQFGDDEWEGKEAEAQAPPARTLRDLLGNLGVTFPDGSSERFSGRTGVLTVTNTEANLELVAKYLEFGPLSPYQVQIKLVFGHLKHDPARELKLGAVLPPEARKAFTPLVSFSLLSVPAYSSEFSFKGAFGTAPDRASLFTDLEGGVTPTYSGDMKTCDLRVYFKVRQCPADKANVPITISREVDLAFCSARQGKPLLAWLVSQSGVEFGVENGLNGLGLPPTINCLEAEITTLDMDGQPFWPRDRE